MTISHRNICGETLLLSLEEQIEKIKRVKTGVTFGEGIHEEKEEEEEELESA